MRKPYDVRKMKAILRVYIFNVRRAISSYNSMHEIVMCSMIVGSCGRIPSFSSEVVQKYILKKFSVMTYSTAPAFRSL